MPKTWRIRNDHSDSRGVRGIVEPLPMCYMSATRPSDVNRQGYMRNCAVPSPMLINACPITVKNSSTTSPPRPTLAPPLALDDVGDEALRCRDLIDAAGRDDRARGDEVVGGVDRGDHPVECAHGYGSLSGEGGGQASAESGLVPVDNTSWIASSDSGLALVAQPGAGQVGELVSGALEQSNVDVTHELVDLMGAQRNYQANTKVISAENEMMQSLMQAL